MLSVKVSFLIVSFFTVCYVSKLAELSCTLKLAEKLDHLKKKKRNFILVKQWLLFLTQMLGPPYI